jgi:hypothetical protein
MRTLGFGVIALVLGVAPAASADVFHTFNHGKVAVATIADVSDDGCIETTGELAALSSTNGTYALALVHRTDHCAGDEPVQHSYGGEANVSFLGLGLIATSASATIVANDLLGHGLPPITIDFSLVFTGTGPVDTNRNHFFSTDGEGGITASFSSSRTRAARVRGSLEIDGEATAVVSGMLATETSGELVIVR